MLYALFLILAIAYNWRKFLRERSVFYTSLIEAKGTAHREMILSHHFYIFIFESFFSLIVAHLISERAMSIGFLGLGAVYITLIIAGIFLYQSFIRYVEKNTGLTLWGSFKSHLIKELRVNFAIVLLPMLIYSLINWTFQDGVYEEWGNLWFIGMLFNLIFVSVLTIVCSVVIMLRLIPNREIIEPEYLDLINKRLSQIQMPNMRIRWIETDIKNAFVVGLKILSFSNQTMFIGRNLRTTLTLEEFDAVIAHELAHVANRHIHKRVIDLLKNFVSIIFGTLVLTSMIIGLAALYLGEDLHIHTGAVTFACFSVFIGWMIFNYYLLFDTIRSHEYEADAYAVMELGASLEAFKTALQKLTSPEELPEYLKARKPKEKSALGSWLAKYFSTHPDLESRFRSVEYKILRGLPFNYYVSPAQKVRKFFRHLLDWKVSVPLASSFVMLTVWGMMHIKSGMEAVAFIQSSSTEAILKKKKLISMINSRPQLVGPSLMAYVIKKRDPRLIDHFIKHGADKGKVLVYISQIKDFDLLQKYYPLYQDKLTEDEYFLILRKSAQMDFTEGYRYLVNARQFENLNRDYKEDVTRLYKGNRLPASENK
ncbi:M48 family metallopeptidase [Peredibacter starrii]|uniref:M48 family metalloprotease n=1 Tax=Peredibacter starrii TaxID=28202 RepID=A0AAX4HRE7_9BACT|nr:M48 family metalloprotease [Peredibacter starrii]WPU65757.1 M48 family metalloprotease [Peredibacter starrii]